MTALNHRFRCVAPFGLLPFVVIAFLSFGKAEADESAPRPGVGADVMQVSPWFVPQGHTVDQMVASAAKFASSYGHVIVVGHGPIADSLADLLAKQLGNDRVKIASELFSPDKLPASADGKVALVIRVTENPAEPISPNECFLVQADTLLSAQEFLRSSLGLIRVAEGTLKDPRTIVNPILKARAERLFEIFGDWSTPEAHEVLERWEKAGNFANWMLAGLDDAEKMSEGGWTPVDSKVFSQFASFAAQKMTAPLLNKLLGGVLTDAAAKDLTGALGIGEFAQGLYEQIGHGHLTIDGLDHYLDAIVAGSWADVGLLVSGGNVRVAKCFSDVAVAVAKAGRDSTKDLIKAIYDRYFGTEIDDAFDDWQVAQINNARQGKPIQSWEDFAKAAGFNADAKGPEMTTAADAVYAACESLADAVAGKSRTAKKAPNADASASENAVSAKPRPNISIPFKTPDPPLYDQESRKRPPPLNWFRGGGGGGPGGGGGGGDDPPPPPPPPPPGGSRGASPPPPPTASRNPPARGGVTMPATVKNSKATDKADTNDVFESKKK